MSSRIPQPGRRSGGRRALCLGLLVLTGCARDDTPLLPPSSVAPGDTLELAGEFGWSGTGADPWPTGTSAWHWRTIAGDTLPVSGRATLDITHVAGLTRGRWQLVPAPPPADSLCLVPDDPATWHSQLTGALSTGEPPPLPLPRLPVDSTLYEDLLALLLDLTAPFFGNIVAHWPATPVPVRTVPAVSGDVDLTACLLEAVATWNRDEPEPLFAVADDAAWGVRLVHFAGAILSPPLRARITRLDERGRPLVIQIIVGDNYDHVLARPYAVRGMVHELTHALFMWGHSRDRNHVLWGTAPPQLDRPSRDERKAVRLWHGLPEGLDLRCYGRAGPAAVQRTSSQ